MPMKYLLFRPATRRAFTLVELMVVIAIIGVLVSITASVIVKAKSAAIVTEDIQSLRQAGVGRELYLADWDAEPLDAVDSLVETGYFTRAQCISRFDSTERGSANIIRTSRLVEIHPHPDPKPFRISLLSTRDFGFEAVPGRLGHQNTGWLIALRQSAPLSRDGGFEIWNLTQPVSRLTYDGSVLRRRAFTYEFDSIRGHIHGGTIQSMFEDTEWKIPAL
jgi:prepilin-type N-terminal cleavage/methylation domain-containing protein